MKKSYSIVFLGTDGAGKSTIIDKIIPVLKNNFNNNVFYEHLRPNLIPPLSRFKGEKKEKGISTPVIDPHSKPTSGKIVSLFRFSYYLVDYIVGYWLKIIPRKLTKPCVWVFDRYYYDYLIDQKRLRINLPKWIIKTGNVIIPKPDLIICLGTDPQNIHIRKPELTLQEVIRQVSELKKFCDSNKRAVWIDTGSSIEESSIETINAINKIMNSNFEFVNR